MKDTRTTYSVLLILCFIPAIAMVLGMIVSLFHWGHEAKPQGPQFQPFMDDWYLRRHDYLYPDELRHPQPQEP